MDTQPILESRVDAPEAGALALVPLEQNVEADPFVLELYHELGKILDEMFPGETWPADTKQGEPTNENSADLKVAVTPAENPAMSVDVVASGAEPPEKPHNNPDNRLRQHLQDAKAKRLAEAVKPEGEEKRECQVEEVQKPADWGMLVPVSAEEQEPPKKRGRKPMMQEAAEPVDGAKASKPKAAARKRKQKGCESEPMEVEQSTGEQREALPKKSKRKTKKDAPEVVPDVQQQSVVKAGKKLKQSHLEAFASDTPAPELSVQEPSVPSKRLRRKGPGSDGQQVQQETSEPKVAKRKAKTKAGRKAKALKISTGNGKDYEPLEVEPGTIEEQGGKAWDSYAAASSACAMYELQHGRGGEQGDLREEQVEQHEEQDEQHEEQHEQKEEQHEQLEEEAKGGKEPAPVAVQEQFEEPPKKYVVPNVVLTKRHTEH